MAGRRTLPAASVALILFPYIVLSRLGAVDSHVQRALACLGVAFAIYWFGCVEGRFRLGLPLILALGLLARLMLLSMPPSDDMYRYIWEGRVLGHGFNPFRLPPDHPALAFLRDADWSLINHRDLPTVYPPLAQGLFWLLAKLSPSVPAFKLAFLAFDVFGFFVLRGFLRARSGASDPTRPGPDSAAGRTADPAESGTAANRILAIHFLNPLLIFEIAGRGHFDSLPVFFNLVFLAALAGRKAAAPFALLLGSLAKISSLALSPLVLSGLGWKKALAWGAAIGAILGASLWTAGAFATLGKFATGFRFNAAIPSVLDFALPFLSGAVRQGIGLALFALAGAACLRPYRNARPERQALAFMGLLLLFSPTLHPWYLLWILPFAALTASKPWLLLTGTVLLTYEVYGRAYVTGEWREIPWIRLPEFLPPLCLFLYLRWKAGRAPA